MPNARFIAIKYIPYRLCQPKQSRGCKGLCKDKLIWYNDLWTDDFLKSISEISTYHAFNYHNDLKGSNKNHVEIFTANNINTYTNYKIRWIDTMILNTPLKLYKNDTNRAWQWRKYKRNDTFYFDFYWNTTTHINHVQILRSSKYQLEQHLKKEYTYVPKLDRENIWNW